MERREGARNQGRGKVERERSVQSGVQRFDRSLEFVRNVDHSTYNIASIVVDGTDIQYVLSTPSSSIMLISPSRFLKKLSHTQLIPRISTSYHQLMAMVGLPGVSPCLT
jgi:hypothetical protein